MPLDKETKELIEKFIDHSNKQTGAISSLTQTNQELKAEISVLIRVLNNGIFKEIHTKVAKTDEKVTKSFYLISIIILQLLGMIYMFIKFNPR